MEGLIDVFRGFTDLLGSLICHQLPYRSLTANGLQLPVCARDTGIYLGMFISTAFIFLSGRRRSDRFPGIIVSITLCIMMLPMIIDGVCSYLSMYVTSNTARLMTGAFFGLPVPFFLIPAANFKLVGKNETLVLKSYLELAVLAAVVLASSMAVLAGLVPYVLLAALFIASFLFFIGRVVFTVVKRAFRLRTAYTYLLSTGAMLCFLAVLYLLSSFVLQPLKAVFQG